MNRPGFSLTIFLITITSQMILATPQASDDIVKSGEVQGSGGSALAKIEGHKGIFQNPSQQKTAGLPAIELLSPHFEASAHSQSLVEIATDTSEASQVKAIHEQVGKPGYLYLGAYSGYFSSDFALALAANISGQSFIQKDAGHSGLEVIDIKIKQNTAVYISKSLEINERLSLGVTGKILYRKQSTLHFAVSEFNQIENFDIDKYSAAASAPGADLGLTYQVPQSPVHPQFAFVLKDVGDTTFSSNKPEAPIDSLYQRLDFGSSISLGLLSGVAQFNLALIDLTSRKRSNFGRKLKWGGRQTWLESFGLNWGVNEGYLAGGLFYKSAHFQFDLGSYAEERGDLLGETPDRRYYLGMGLII